MVDVYHSRSLDESFISNLEPELKACFEGCKTIAVKIHFGEPGNKMAFVPEDVKPVLDILTKIGLDFFLYDSSVAYESPRNSPETHKRAALEKGWGELGSVRTDDDFIKVKKDRLTYDVAKPLADADGVLVLTHVKGHSCSGFGGAIKNLGMGALSKETKSAIHSGGNPVYISGCVQCKACEAACPLGTLKVEEGPVFGTCYGCSNCVYVCPEKAIKPKLAGFDLLLAEGATAAHESFKKAYYISLVHNISKECDCESDPKQIIAPDCGVLTGKDPVAIDRAAHALIVEAAGEDPFLKHNKKTGLQHVEAAEKCGMGTANHELLEL